MANGNLVIPDLWPGDRAEGLGRALYNIALNRVSPGKPPETEIDFINATVDSKPYRLRIRASTVRWKWHIAIPCRDLTKLNEEERNQSLQVGILAVWRDAERPRNDRVIHTWLIPASVLKDTLIDAALDNLGRWKVDIVNRRVWSVNTNEDKRAAGDYYTEWWLNDQEFALIPQPDSPRHDDSPTKIIWSDGTVTDVCSWREVRKHVLDAATKIGLDTEDLKEKKSVTDIWRQLCKLMRDIQGPPIGVKVKYEVKDGEYDEIVLALR